MILTLCALLCPHVTSFDLYRPFLGYSSIYIGTIFRVGNRICVPQGVV